jgi:YebC/PmpR family DNA-binding regulatory protein
MSGHSKWSTIKRQKGVKDAARGAIFTKLGNAIAIAARSGVDPETNFTLRLAIDKAKSFNMPMANIQRSIDRIKDKSLNDLQELLYEGYGPGGVAILVSVATDNINRTYPEVKLAFSKHGGSIAEKGSVAFLFDQKGMIRLKGHSDEIELMAIDAGAEDVIIEDEDTIIYTPFHDLARVRDYLQDHNADILEAELSYIPNSVISVEDKDTALKIVRLMNALDDIDDVTDTYTNFEINPDLLESN